MDATSIVHSRLDCCNSLYCRLPNSQLNGLQHIQNVLVCAVVDASKFSQTSSPIVTYLHWLRLKEHTEYMLLSVTYKILTTTNPAYLYKLISIQPPCHTCSSSVTSISLPSSSSSLKVPLKLCINPLTAMKNSPYASGFLVKIKLFKIIYAIYKIFLSPGTNIV